MVRLCRLCSGLENRIGIRGKANAAFPRVGSRRLIAIRDPSTRAYGRVPSKGTANNGLQLSAAANADAIRRDVGPGGPWEGGNGKVRRAQEARAGPDDERFASGEPSSLPQTIDEPGPDERYGRCRLHDGDSNDAVDSRQPVITSIAKPCGHRFSGDSTDFRALLRAKADAITGIIRADSASVKSIRLSRLAQSSFSDDSQRWPRGRDCLCDSGIVNRFRARCNRHRGARRS